MKEVSTILAEMQGELARTQDKAQSGLISDDELVLAVADILVETAMKIAVLQKNS